MANLLVDDLRSWWLSQIDLAQLIGQRAHYLHVPQSYIGAYLWYARVGSHDDEDRCLDDQPGEELAFRELVDVEGISKTPAEAEKICLLLRRLDSWSTWDGPVGNGKIQAAFVRDHTDDYLAQGTGGDTGLSVSAVRFEILGYQPGS